MLLVTYYNSLSISILNKIQMYVRQMLRGKLIYYIKVRHRAFAAALLFFTISAQLGSNLDR